MVDPSSEQKKTLYDRLLADANEVFDLWWLNEELTERLFNERNFAPVGTELNFEPCEHEPNFRPMQSELNSEPCEQSQFGFSSFARWHRSWYEDAELFFASQYLLTYRDALCEIAAIVDEEMPRDYYEGQLKEDLWAFVSTELGKAWRATKQTDKAENRTHRWKISAKYVFSQHRLGKVADVNEFLRLLHRVAILNDVLNHRAKRHGLVYTKRKEKLGDGVDPITAFCNQVKDIVNSFAQKNGEVVSTNAKGVAGQYVWKVDAKNFCSMMNELRNNYDYYLNDYLEGRDATDAIQLSLVCPFIGFVFSLNIINTPQLQNTDLEPILLQYYPGKKSLIAALSKRSGFPAERVLFSMVETLLKDYRERCITFLKSVSKPVSR